MKAKVFAFATMSVGFFIALLDIQIVSASLGEIGGGLSAGPDEIAWVQTSYLIAEIVVIPLSGWLSRVISTRWLFSVSAAGFTATSLLRGWAWNIQSMIVFRGLQGFLGGSMIPTVFTSAFFYFTGKRRVIAAAVIGTISSLAPTLGPTIGGWITENYSWHWLFFINLLPGTFVAIAVPMLVHIDRPNLALLRGADYPGIVLMALFLGCLQYTLEEDRAGTGWRRHNPCDCMDFWHRRSRLRLAQPDLCATHRRSARAEKPEFLTRLFLFLCHRYRDFWDDISDATVSRPGARLQRARDRSCRILDRRFPSPSYSDLHFLHSIHRSSLADDGGLGLLRVRHVELYPYYP